MRGFGSLAAAIVLALAGVTLAAFAWPQLRRSDELFRVGVRAEATVVALDPDTCFHGNRRTNQQYPCFRLTGEWTHTGITYRTTLGYSSHAHEAPLGSSVPIVFAPDPAAAAGRADLRFRVVGEGQSAPRSERVVYMALLVTAGLLNAPLVTLVLRTRAR